MSHSDEYKRIIRAISKDGWYLVKDNGHKQFRHPYKTGKVTIPHRITKNIELSILKQAGLK